MRALAALALVSMLVPLAYGGGALPLNPVVNGDFELSGDQGLETPADAALATCVGVGHQAFYGDDTLQGDLLARESPQAAAERVSGDPAGTALFTAGVGHCVWDEERGYDLAWVTPSDTAQRPAIGWSSAVDSAVSWGDVDGDLDREALVRADPARAELNLWQSFASPHQTATADFDALEFVIENGATPAGRVVLLLSVTPLERPSAFAPVFADCELTFDAALLRGHLGGDGRVSVDPALARLTKLSQECARTQAAWAAADALGRHEILGRLRIVELAFRGFNLGSQDVVLDDVTLAWTRTPAETLAAPFVTVPYEVPVALPCAFYGSDTDGDGSTDQYHLRTCDWTLERGGSLTRSNPKTTTLP